MKRSLKIFLGVLGAVLALVVLAPSAAQAAVHYFSTTRTVTGTGSVSCPAGTHVTGGGVGQLPHDVYSPFGTNRTEYYVTGSFPNHNGWTATATKTQSWANSNTTMAHSSWSSYTPKVYAICVG